MQRPNLEVRTGYLVQKVILEGQRATGVEIFKDRQSVALKANKEVLLCAGAINSPQILMLSGIGPAAHLQEQGIAVKNDLPGVGQKTYRITWMPLSNGAAKIGAVMPCIGVRSPITLKPVISICFTATV